MLGAAIIRVSCSSTSTTAALRHVDDRPRGKIFEAPHRFHGRGSCRYLYIERAARVLEVRPRRRHHPMKTAVFRIAAPVASDEHDPRRNDVTVGTAHDATHASGCKTRLARIDADRFPITSSPARG